MEHVLFRPGSSLHAACIISTRFIVTFSMYYFNQAHHHMEHVLFRPGSSLHAACIISTRFIVTFSMYYFNQVYHLYMGHVRQPVSDKNT